MKDLPNKKKNKDVQLHIDAAYELFDKYLPSNYLKLVLEKLPEGTHVSKSTINNMKQKRIKPSANMEVFKALTEVAVDVKNEIESINKLIS